MAYRESSWFLIGLAFSVASLSFVERRTKTRGKANAVGPYSVLVGRELGLFGVTVAHACCKDGDAQPFPSGCFFDTKWFLSTRLEKNNT